MNRSAIHRQRQSRRQQPRKSPVDSVLGNIASLGWILRVGPRGQDRFVGDGRIIVTDPSVPAKERAEAADDLIEVVRAYLK
jgi:hypothetical protein